MDTFLLLGIIVAFLFAGFFAGIEIGFVTLNRLSVELRKKQRSKNAMILSEFMESPSQFISVMIVGVSISISIYGMLIDELLTPLWKSIEGYLIIEFIPYFVYIRILFDLAISAIAFLFYFFFCRAIFRAKSDTLMFFITPLLSFFNRIFYPIANFIVSLSQWVLKNIVGLKMKL